MGIARYFFVLVFSVLIFGSFAPSVFAIDTTPPVITLLGSNPMTVAHGSTFTDPSATALDDVDGPISGSIVSSGTVNTSTVGAYTRTYVVQDSAGNVATSTRTVNVTDQTAPTIASQSNTTAEATSASGATVSFSVATSDNVDSAGSATCSPSSASTFALGTTTVSCTATDTAGNAAATTTFSIIIRDTTAPVITLSGSNPMSVFQDSTFTDPGATTTDAVSGSTTIVTSGSVNMAIVGTYTLTYVTNDTANNYATSTRTVNVLITSITLSTSANGDGTLTGTTTSATTASTTSSGIVVTLTIPSGTAITGTSTWNSKVITPVATTTYTLTANSGYTASAISITEMGAGDTALTLDQAAQVLFAGQAGKLVGWWQAGSFHQIISTCNSTTTPTLSAGADCKVDIGSDLAVWTKHLTTFIIYTETAIPVPSSSSSSGSGGGGSSGGGGGGTSLPSTATATTTIVVAPTSTIISAPVIQTTTTSTQGQVLGVQTYNFTKNLGIGSKGAEVSALQKFLFDRKFYADEITGYFGPLTKVAVMRFQKANGIEQAGSVGPLTRAKLNKARVSVISKMQKKSSLTTFQASAILAVLSSFGADASIIAKVRVALGM